MSTPRRPSGRTEDGKLRFASRIVYLGILNITIYTAVAFIMQWITGSPPPDSLTAAFIGFWGTEMVAVAFIRVTKEKKKKGGSNDDYSE